MKVLDVSAITDASQMPIKKGTLEFMQDAHIENIRNLIKALIGPSYSDTNKYVLYGCVNSGSGTTYNISAGVIFYAGTIYEVPAASFTAPVGQTAVCDLSITQYMTDADPVTFTDMVSRDVHDIINMVIVAGVSASTIFGDYSTVVFSNPIFASHTPWVDETAQWTFGGHTAVVGTKKIKVKVIGKTVHIKFAAVVTSTGSVSNVITATPASGSQLFGQTAEIAGSFSKQILNILKANSSGQILGGDNYLSHIDNNFVVNIGVVPAGNTTIELQFDAIMELN